MFQVRGHLASSCVKGVQHESEPMKGNYIISQVQRKKYKKEVMINGYQTTALIDTRSDITLMTTDQYVKISSPELQSKEIIFRGAVRDRNSTLGEFVANLIIKNNQYTTAVQIISKHVIEHKFILGTDFLDKVEINIKGGDISTSPLCKTHRENEETAEIFQKDVIDHSHKVDIANFEHRNTIETMISEYQPFKIRDVDVKMSILLTDDEPVYQRARRLSPSERELVNNSRMNG